jgi:hypothetical protein
MLSKSNFRYKTIVIPQSWGQAYDNWVATREEKRSFREQFFYFQNPEITFKSSNSERSYFSQVKNGACAVHSEAEKFANQFFGINRKF